MVCMRSKGVRGDGVGIAVGVGQHDGFRALKDDGPSRFSDGLLCLVQAVEVLAVRETPTGLSALAIFLTLEQRKILRRRELHQILGREIGKPLLCLLAEHGKIALIQAHDFAVSVVVRQNDSFPLGIIGHLERLQLLHGNTVAALFLAFAPHQPGQRFPCGIKARIEVTNDCWVNALHHFNFHIWVKGLFIE